VRQFEFSALRFFASLALCRYLLSLGLCNETLNFKLTHYQDFFRPTCVQTLCW